MSDEGQDSIDIFGHGSRAYAGYLATVLPGNGTAVTADQFLQYMLGQDKVCVTKVLWRSPTWAQHQSNGAVQS